MIPTQLTLPDGDTHLNRGLFSDYYLNNIVPKRADWDGLHAEARRVYEALRDRLSAIRPEKLDEAQLEEQWIKPVLAQLGWSWSVQVKIRYQTSGHRKPDYALTATPETARALTNQIYTPAELTEAGVMAVADAKTWGSPLDQAARGERNPSQQIDEYLRFSELSWGILTDGRYWRLYERDSSKNNVYYAVDLPALLAKGSVEIFQYFYAFFRPAAFVPNGFLTAVLEGSESYARRVSDQLEDQVFEALEFIAQGFLTYRRNKLTAAPDTLRRIYGQSLILLYRLLFILYAESRDVLPIGRNRAYAARLSLEAIRKFIPRHGLTDFVVDDDELYSKLTSLFFYIDKGSAEYTIPPYNGRLFSETEHRFLAQHKVGDLYFAKAIDKLARVPDEADPRKLVFVDYRDLAIRHMGAIYEKLLDYELDFTEQPLTLRNGKYSPAENGDAVIVAAESAYLRTGNRERKVTGSVYTPDYIVRFITERTLEPLLNAISARYATLDAEGRWQVEAANAPALTAAILELNILDPATGSGHFMVDATSYIAEWLRGLALHPADLPAGEDELLYWKRQVVNACIYGVDINPLAVELAKLSLWLTTLAQGKPLSFLDHHLKTGDTLVGTFAARIGATLTDFRSEQRGSARDQQAAAAGQLTLIEEPDFAPALSLAVTGMAEIEHRKPQTVADVKAQETLYQTLREATASWRTLADFWVARHFGLALDQAAWTAVKQQVQDGAQSDQSGQTDEGARIRAKLLEQQTAIPQAARFLHWDLTFPEVFFKPDGTPLANPGFDAIIGNPPYVRQEFIQPIKGYLGIAHAPVYDGTADLYVYFFHRGLELLRRGGRLGYITANKWFRAGYGEPLREFLAANVEVREIVDFGDAPIFKNVDTFPAITLVEKSLPHPPTPSSTSGEGEQTLTPQLTQGAALTPQPPLPAGEGEQERPATRVTLFPRAVIRDTDPEFRTALLIKDYVKAHGYSVPAGRFGASPWSLEPTETDALMGKIRAAGVPLQEFINASPHRGFMTGYNNAFFINGETKNRLIADDPKCETIIKPYLRGRDIKRWLSDWDQQWMILLQSSASYTWKWTDAPDAEQVFATQYPSVYAHFKSLEPQLRSRQNPVRYWWELSSPSQEFLYEKPKILYQEIQTLSSFAYDNSKLYMNNTCCMLPSGDLYLLAVLNSPVLWWFGYRYFPPALNDARRPFAEKMIHLPIAPPTDAIRAEVEPAVERMIALTGSRRAAVGDLLTLLKKEFGVEPPGAALSAFVGMSEDSFVDEVRNRRGRGAGRLTLAGLRDLSALYREAKAQTDAIDSEMATLEKRVSDAVTRAYSLTPAEIDLLWQTAPPRMPGVR